MNDFEIDKILTDINTSVPSALEEKVLSASTRAFKRSHFIRKSIRRGAMAISIVIFGFAAFLAGRLSTNNPPSFPAPVDQDMVSIQVPKDFLAWVDAGRFFIQLDMKDRASNAFDKALSMIPKDMPIANQDNPKAFLCSGSLTNLNLLMSQTIAMTDTQLLQYFNHTDKTERKEQ
jgi:hypothetical protein